MPNTQHREGLVENFGCDQAKDILRIVFPLLKKYNLKNRLLSNIPKPHHRAISEFQKTVDTNYYSPKYKERNDLYEMFSLLYDSIKERCYNEKYLQYMYYGGRGILMYKSWKENKAKFIQYCINYLGPKPERYYFVDRIDNNKGYVPGNLRWAHPRVSAMNRNISICKNENIRYAASYIYKYYNITHKKLLIMFINEALIDKTYSPNLQIAFNQMVHKNIINV